MMEGQRCGGEGSEESKRREAERGGWVAWWVGAGSHVLVIVCMLERRMISVYVDA